MELPEVPDVAVILVPVKVVPQVIRDALVDLIMNLSCLIMENPDIKKLDLNPVRVYEKGVVALDARISSINQLS